MARVDVERQLREDEEVEVTVTAGGGRLVLTSHRVFAVTPERDGPNFATARRPNVEAVEEETTGGTDHLERGIKASVVGLLLLGISVSVDLAGLLGNARVDGETAGQLGVGQVVAMLDALQTGLTLLDSGMLVGGFVAVLGGLASLGLFIRERQRNLVVRVAGGEELKLDADVSDSDLADLQRRLEYE
jgi:hypothetical protein